MKASVKVLLVVAGMVLLLGTFILGTAVGFRTAMSSVSSCEPVDCADIGVEAGYCEVCKSDGLRVLARSG